MLTILCPLSFAPLRSAHAPLARLSRKAEPRKTPRRRNNAEMVPVVCPTSSARTAAAAPAAQRATFAASCRRRRRPTPCWGVASEGEEEVPSGGLPGRKVGGGASFSLLEMAPPGRIAAPPHAAPPSTPTLCTVLTIYSRYSPRPGATAAVHTRGARGTNPSSLKHTLHCTHTTRGVLKELSVGSPLP